MEFRKYSRLGTGIWGRNILLSMVPALLDTVFCGISAPLVPVLPLQVEARLGMRLVWIIPFRIPSPGRRNTEEPVCEGRNNGRGVRGNEKEAWVEMLVKIEKEYKVNAPREKVWDSLIDFSRESENWEYIRDVKVLKHDGNIIEREATVGPRPFGARTRQVITMEPKNSINVRIEGESMNGKRLIRISEDSSGKTLVNVEWNIEIKEVPGFVREIISSQLTKSTNRAISMIDMAGNTDD